jgi:Carboxypeptidase regulatory-like domain
MTNTLRRVLAFVTLTLGLTAGACGDGSLTGPTASRNDPPVRNDVPAWNDVSISGVVYDTAQRLLHGATVEVIEGVVEGYWCHSPVRPTPVCTVTTVTDEAGRFSFSGGFETVTRLRASMQGYVAATLTVDFTTSTGAIEFRLERSVAP